MIYDLEGYKRTLAGWVLETVDDAAKAKEIIDAVVSYGDSCYAAGVEDSRTAAMRSAAELLSERNK